MEFQEGDRVKHYEHGLGTVQKQSNGLVIYLGEMHVVFDDDDEDFRVLQPHEVSKVSEE